MNHYIYSILNPFKPSSLLRKYYKNHKDSDMPFIASNDMKVKTMLELAEVKPQEKSIDLGAGDGKIVIAFAKKGAQAYGIETDETLTELARHNIKKMGLERKASIIRGDFWNISLGSYDIITVYGLTRVMERLEGKIRFEAKKGCRIICNYFPFPNLKPDKTKNGVNLYKIR